MLFRSGFGDPAKRSKAALADDLRNEYLSPATLERDYDITARQLADT